MPELPWHTVQYGIQKLREIGMLEQIYHVRSVHPPQEDTAFENVQNKF